MNWYLSKEGKVQKQLNIYNEVLLRLGERMLEMVKKIRKLFLITGWFCIFTLFPLGNTSLGVLCMLLAFIFGHIPESLKTRFFTYEYKLLTVFCGVMVLSSVSSRNPIESLTMTLAQILIFYLVFIGADYIVKHYNYSSQVYLKLFYVSGLVSGLISLIKFIINNTKSYRTSTLFTGVNGTGTVMLVVVLLSLPIILEQKELGKRWTGLFGMLLPLSGLFLTFSRGAYIGFAGGVTAYLVRSRKAVIYFWIGFLVLTLLLLTLFPFGQNRVLSIFSLEKNQIRIMVWETSLKMIKDHPLLGVGTGLYSAHFSEYKPKSYRHNMSIAHNLELQILAEFGILGFLPFMTLLLIILKRNVQLIKMYPDQQLYRGIFAALVGYLLHNQVDGTMVGFELGSFFWVLSGFIIHKYYEGIVKEEEHYEAYT